MFFFEELLELFLGPGLVGRVIVVIFCCVICFSYSIKADHRLNAAFRSCFSSDIFLILLGLFGVGYCRGFYEHVEWAWLVSFLHFDQLHECFGVILECLLVLYCAISS